jgi:iron complex transport system permease protein
VRLALVRVLLIGALALATGAAVAQMRADRFVGLVAPHLVRSWGPVTHRELLLLSPLAGACCCWPPTLPRAGVISPQELPVGIITALLGGSYLLWLMHRSSSLGGGRAA